MLTAWKLVPFIKEVKLHLINEDDVYSIISILVVLLFGILMSLLNMKVRPDETIGYFSESI